VASDTHQIKAGLSYQILRHKYLFEMYDAGEMTYLTDDRSLPFFYTHGIGPSDVELQSELIGLFAQDDWLATNGLTLSLGLRYDVDIGGNNPDFEHPLLPDRRGTDWNNFQPRVGFTWDLTRNGVNVLRGGAGLFTGRYTATPPLAELQFNEVTGRYAEIRVGPTVDDPENTGVPFPPSIYLLGESFLLPQSTQVTLGYSRRIGNSSLYLDVEGIYVDGRNEHVIRDSNWAGNDNPGRIDPAYTIVGQWIDEGYSEYRALQLGLNGTIKGGHLISAWLSLSDKKNIQDDPQSPQEPSDSADLDAEWGRSRTDERYRFVASGVFRLPWDLALAPVFEYGSGAPWNRLYGYDFNGDLWFGDRPPGTPRYGEDGPPFRQLNLRLTKGFPLAGTKRLDLIVEAFNVFDTTNYDVFSVDNAMYFSGPTLSGDPTQPFDPNPGFGQYKATHAPREIQLGLRYSF
jgi:hypothetical protein